MLRCVVERKTFGQMTEPQVNRYTLETVVHGVTTSSYLPTDRVT